ncbi:hypothetical protein ABK040_002495 [Willaertia magna]
MSKRFGMEDTIGDIKNNEMLLPTSTTTATNNNNNHKVLLEEEPEEKKLKIEEQGSSSNVSSSSSSNNNVVGSTSNNIVTKKIPATVLTGFLGAGKTTLLNYILSKPHGYKIAIIENEFGEISIDDALVVTSNEEVVELSNGCLCCTLRGDLIKALTNLTQRKEQFDYVLIETTGLANPGPIVQTFYLDNFISKHFHLDGIVTMVDCKHILKQLDRKRNEKHLLKKNNQLLLQQDLHHNNNDEEEEEEEEEIPNEAEDQIAFADRIILNKIDLVDEKEREFVKERIRFINGLSPLLETSYSNRPDLNFLLGIRAFDIDRVLQLDAKVLEEINNEHHHNDHHDHHHDHHDEKEGHDHHKNKKEKEQQHHTKHHHHKEDPDAVKSVAILMDGELDEEKFEDWIYDLLTEYGDVIYRTKGILNIHGKDKPQVVQAVHMLLDSRSFGEWKNQNDKRNRLVFIGKYLDRDELMEGFKKCFYDPNEENE